jgi:adenylate cyclase
LIEKKNLVEFIKQLIINNFNKNVIIFIDEVDSIINEPFENKVSEFFFQQLGLFYKYKKKDNSLNRIGFALFGVTSPYDLTNEMNKEPFKSGRPINLHFLPFSNSKILIKGFAKINSPKTKLLKEIFKWTSGQPYLTQKLCLSIATNEVEIFDIETIVLNHVITLFLNESVLINDNNLSNVHSRILKSKDLLTNLLSIYSKILSGSKISYLKSDKSHVYLKLSGLIDEKKGLICIANKIYESCFNNDWLERINDQK